MRLVNMVVLVRNLQSRTLLNLPGLLQNCNTLVDILRISYFDVNVIFVGKGFIKSLNLRYRRKNVVTDILSFPSIENLTPGVLPPLPRPVDDYTLGDIVLGTPKIVEDCEADGKHLDDYLPVLITHGLCHLLGYTHDTQKKLNKMRSKEMEVLTEFNKRTGLKTVPIMPEKIEHLKYKPLPDEKKIVTDEIAVHERMNNKVEEVLREE